MDETVESLRELLTLDELTNRVGMSVRNVRFYTTKGLVPPPIRRGRSGYYTPDHVARLELVQELQSHGFTLAAIERYVARIPRDATPEDIALHRTMLAPWQAEMPDRDDARRARQARRPQAGRRRPGHAGRPRHRAAAPSAAATRWPSPSSSVGLGLLDLGFPTEAALAAAEVYAAHGRQIAEELYELFRTKVWPALQGVRGSPERLQEVVERLKPLSIASLVAAYEAAMDETEARGHRPAGAVRPTRPAPAADATPSQVCGLPSQHQPSLGARSLIHIAGTRRS